jgi:hypothetical protein
VARLHGAWEGDRWRRLRWRPRALLLGWKDRMTVVMGWAQRPIGPGETGGRMKIKEWKKFNRPAAGLNVTLGRYWSWAARTFLEFNQSFCVQN